ncbi:hypothetical protein [Streptomyces sp. NPDC056512]|uniref:hypothetical protein n=1 Tax=Streptomyces sp. NPDC056512 TaxID=3345846 RepID=UPI0036B51149
MREEESFDLENDFADAVGARTTGRIYERFAARGGREELGERAGERIPQDMRCQGFPAVGEEVLDVGEGREILRGF